jgi:hypothetical protein
MSRLNRTQAEVGVSILYTFFSWSLKALSLLWGTEERCSFVWKGWRKRHSGVRNWIAAWSVRSGQPPAGIQGMTQDACIVISHHGLHFCTVIKTHFMSLSSLEKMFTKPWMQERAIQITQLNISYQKML